MTTRPRALIAAVRRVAERRIRVSLLVAGLALLVPIAAVLAAPKGWSVALTPGTVTAGSTGNTFNFVFSTGTVGQGTFRIVIPTQAAGTQWTAPQSSNATAPGYVSVVTSTCSAAQLDSISGTGPWTVTATASCPASGSFRVSYGDGAGTVVAPTKAATATFAVSASAKGKKSFTGLPGNTQVVIAPGAATHLAMTGLAGSSAPGFAGMVVAGTQQSVTVTALDQYDNIATGYRGTVGFDVQVPAPPFMPETLPGDYVFRAADAGRHVFTNGVTLVYSLPSDPGPAGVRTLTVNDKNNGAVANASLSRLVIPGPAASIRLIQAFEMGTAEYGFDTLPRTGDVVHATLIEGQSTDVGVTELVYDAFGNLWHNNVLNQDRSITLEWSVPSGATLPDGLPGSINHFMAGIGATLTVPLARYEDGDTDKAGLTVVASMPSDTGDIVSARITWDTTIIAPEPNYQIVEDPTPELDGTYIELPQLDGVLFAPADFISLASPQTNDDGTSTLIVSNLNLVSCDDQLFGCEPITGTLVISATTGSGGTPSDPGVLASAGSISSTTQPIAISNTTFIDPNYNWNAAFAEVKAYYLGAVYGAIDQQFMTALYNIDVSCLDCSGGLIDKPHAQDDDFVAVQHVVPSSYSPYGWQIEWAVTGNVLSNDSGYNNLGCGFEVLPLAKIDTGAPYGDLHLYWNGDMVWRLGSVPGDIVTFTYVAMYCDTASEPALVTVTFAQTGG